VLYTLERLPGVDRHRTLADVLHYVNFVAPPIDAVRDPLFFGVMPSLADALYTVVAAVVALALGAFVFSRVDDRIAVEL
jgi:ABC-type polysaccharide/polyol phosphate export permease